MTHFDSEDYEDEYEPHLTQSVEVKPGVFADIDMLMVPLVKWLNQSPAITTHFCCEGEDDGESTGRPYVMVTCTDLNELRRITNLMHTYADGEFNCRNELRFTFRFWSKQHLRSMLEWLYEVEQATASAPFRCRQHTPKS